MPQEIIGFVQGFNLQTILSMGLIVWYFSRDVKSSLESKIDNLDRDVRAMNTRVGRLEGAIYGKDVYKSTKEE